MGSNERREGRKGRQNEGSYIWFSYVPHTSEKLDETTVAQGQGDDDVGHSYATGLEIDGGENEGGERESAETQGSRVGELAVLDRAVETRLELTTEGGEPSLLVRVDMGHRVSIVVTLSRGSSVERSGASGLAMGILLDGGFVRRHDGRVKRGLLGTTTRVVKLTSESTKEGEGQKSGEDDGSSLASSDLAGSFGPLISLFLLRLQLVVT